MAFTVDDARRYLINLLPPGAELLYDLTTHGDMYKLLDGWGATFKQFGFDLLDTLRRELFPSTATPAQKLPDWEGATGISNLNPALFGTAAARQQALIAKLRESGAFCDPVVQSVLGPLLGYNPTTVPELLKASRSNLRQAHQHNASGFFTVLAGDSEVDQTRVNFGGKISRSGLQLDLSFVSSGVSGAELVVTLRSPAGTLKTWPAGTIRGASLDDQTWRLYAASDFAGEYIQGLWTLTLFNNGGVPLDVDDWWIFLEGIGPGEDTGGAIFQWGVFADLAHMGESGVPADFGAVRAAIARIKHSHTLGDLISSKDPWPDTDSGAHAAIPDQCVPV